MKYILYEEAVKRQDYNLPELALSDRAERANDSDDCRAPLCCCTAVEVRNESDRIFDTLKKT